MKKLIIILCMLCSAIGLIYGAIIGKLLIMLYKLKAYRLHYFFTMWRRRIMKELEEKFGGGES